MKQTIIIECPDDKIREAFRQAEDLVLGGNEPGSYGTPRTGIEITISGEWPEDAEECLPCGGNAFQLKDTSE
jgi:hypothetical protein